MYFLKFFICCNILILLNFFFIFPCFSQGGKENFHLDFLFGGLVDRKKEITIDGIPYQLKCDKFVDVYDDTKKIELVALNGDSVNLENLDLFNFQREFGDKGRIFLFEKENISVNNYLPNNNNIIVFLHVNPYGKVHLAIIRVNKYQFDKSHSFVVVDKKHLVGRERKFFLDPLVVRKFDFNIQMRSFPVSACLELF